MKSPLLMPGRFIKAGKIHPGKSYYRGSETVPEFRELLDLTIETGDIEERHAKILTARPEVIGREFVLARNRINNLLSPSTRNALRVNDMVALYLVYLHLFSEANEEPFSVDQGSFMETVNLIQNFAEESYGIMIEDSQIAEWMECQTTERRFFTIEQVRRCADLILKVTQKEGFLPLWAKRHPQFAYLSASRHAAPVLEKLLSGFDPKIHKNVKELISILSRVSAEKIQGDLQGKRVSPDELYALKDVQKAAGKGKITLFDPQERAENHEKVVIRAHYFRRIIQILIGERVLTDSGEVGKVLRMEKKELDEIMGSEEETRRIDPFAVCQLEGINHLHRPGKGIHPKLPRKEAAKIHQALNKIHA